MLGNMIFTTDTSRKSTRQSFVEDDKFRRLERAGLLPCKAADLGSIPATPVGSQSPPRVIPEQLCSEHSQNQKQDRLFELGDKNATSHAHVHKALRILGPARLNPQGANQDAGQCARDSWRKQRGPCDRAVGFRRKSCN